MSVAYPSRVDNVIYELRHYGGVVADVCSSTTQKVIDFVKSPAGQVIVGLGIGVCLHKIYSPLTERALKAMGFTVGNVPDPFMEMSLSSKIMLGPLICIVGPIAEEFEFRLLLQDFLTYTFQSLYERAGMSNSTANITARITSIFLTSVVFGLVHFSNALVFWCNPVLFLPQVIAATMMGLVFSLAKEFSGELYLPCGMHIGNNTLAWAHMLVS